MKFPILYEDNHLLVVEKPVNIAVQADDSQDPDLLTLLKQDLKERYQKPGNVYLGLVHRLDRPVGGVMVFAKTSKAASRLSDQVRAHGLDKTYAAVICGQMEHRQDSLQDYLWKDTRNNRVSVVSASHPGAKLARLSYEQLETRDGLTLLRIHLETGRSHQIRVQFASRSAALWGDQRYNPAALPGQQIALWACQLSFDHPVTKERLTFVSRPPERMPWNQFKDLKGV